MGNPTDRKLGNGDETPVAATPVASGTPDSAMPAVEAGADNGSETRADAVVANGDGSAVDRGWAGTTEALSVVSDIDYRRVLDRLAECTTPQKLFERIHTEIDEILRTDDRIRTELGEIESGYENILLAVCLNDFDKLVGIDRNSEEYNTVLRLAAIKNAMIIELTKLALDAYGKKLGITEMEKTTILGFQRIVPDVDNIYIQWRRNLFPDSLRKNKEFKKDPEAYLTKHGLDDPYAVVVENEAGAYESGPCHIAFADDYKKLKEAIDEFIHEIGNVTIDSENEQAKRLALVEYLTAYVIALTCPSEKTEGARNKNSKWLSQKRWKKVDVAWLKCRERIQFIHGIENGSDSELDPSETKIFPEFKIAIQHTDPETDRSLTAMRVENANALRKMLAVRFGWKGKLSYRVIKLRKTLYTISRSHVGLISVVSGAGNSMDALGCAQLAPNYEDVRNEHGAKAYVSAPDLLEGESARDTVTDEVFGEEGAKKLDFRSGENADNNWRNYVANYVGGHELGHLFIGEIEGFEETKATWVGLIGLHEREKTGLLPKGTAEEMMKAHIKNCLRALSDTVKLKGDSADEGPLDIARDSSMKRIKEYDDYDKEGIINARIFLKTGLISVGEGGKYVFNPEKIEDAYEEIEKALFEFVKISTTITDDSLEEWIDGLIRGEGGSKTLANLRRLSFAGKLRHNSDAKKNAGAGLGAATDASGGDALG